MRVSYEWLKEMVDLPADPATLVSEFVRTGTEVEAVEDTASALRNVVTGHVVEAHAHPDSDHMQVCTVDVGGRNLGADGAPEPLQIVCGAPNMRTGLDVVVALIGAVLPGGFEITRAKKRGVESCGMCCSYAELGLSTDHSGIIELPEGTEPGQDFATYSGLGDVILDCEMTPNRPDCLSMEGVAVEVSAIFDEDTHIQLPTIQDEQGTPAADLVDVRIDDPEMCCRYAARVVRDVKIGPSPDWLAKRVNAAGSRSINNVVDVTNYVMYLTGQPLHAFDLGKLREIDGKRHIVVRAASDGEQIETLDGQLRSLTPDTCLITDNGDRPVALAGVMGGENSKIDETTVDVLLESACFQKGHISRTSRNLGLMSEASIRFERQVDAYGCVEVADIAAALFESCCGATVCPGVVDVVAELPELPRITFRPERARAMCGADISDDVQLRFLRRLGCEVEAAGTAPHKGVQVDAYTVVPPTFRPDLTREADLVEEVLRLFGMANVPATIPGAADHIGGLTEQQHRARLIDRTLRACGLSETVTYVYCDHRDLERLGMSEEGRGIAVKVMNPLVADQSEMRRSLIPGLLRSVAYNKDHGQANVTLYEMGRVLFGHKGHSLPREVTYVAGVLSGRWDDEAWNQAQPELDFFDAKGIVEQLLATLRLPKVRFKVAEPERYGWLQPGRAAEVLSGGEVIGWVGNVHPTSLKRFDIDDAVVAFELSVDALQRLAQGQQPYEDIPTLPGVSVDLAIVVDESVSYEMLVQRIRSAGGKLLRDVRLFDVYRDPVRVGLGKKSMAFALTYRADDHTLTSEEVEKAHNKLVTKVCKATGGEVRG